MNYKSVVINKKGGTEVLKVVENPLRRPTPTKRVSVIYRNIHIRLLYEQMERLPYLSISISSAQCKTTLTTEQAWKVNHV